MDSPLIESLSACVKEKVGYCKGGEDAQSMHAIQQLRHCVAELSGSHSEEIAWDLAVARAAKVSAAPSDAAIVKVWAEMRPDCIADVNRRYVPLDPLIQNYLTNITDLIGEEVLIAQVRRCLNVEVRLHLPGE